MLKNFTTSLSLIIAFFCINNANGQGQGNSNALKVVQVASPVANFNYKLNDSVDIIIRIRNEGPNALIAGDQFKLTYSVANNDTTYSDDTLVQVGEAMAVNRILEYTIIEDLVLDELILDSAFNFSVCADVSGTVIYPVNTNKIRNACSAFIVGIEKLKPSVESIFYANGSLNFKINHPTQLKAYVFDLTGRQLAGKTINPKLSQSIDLSNPSKGFYFLKLIDKAGNSAITKFVIN